MSSRDAVTRLLGIDPAAPANPRDLSRWLRCAHPDDVSRADIEREVAREEARIAAHHRVAGLVYPIVIDLTDDGRAQRGTRIHAVADTALFNGIHLAGLVAKYGATGDPSVLREVGAAVDAMYALTHLAGVPGLLTRYAVPLDRARESRVGTDRDRHERTTFMHVYYRAPGRACPEYAHVTSIVGGRDGLAPVGRSPAGHLLTGETLYGDHFLYTRTSRDQLTGVVFGLAFAMKAFEAPAPAADRELWSAIRRTLAGTAIDLYGYLRGHAWTMEDPVTGARGRASAVSGLLRTAVELLFRRSLMNQWTDESWRDGTGASLGEHLGWLRDDTAGACLPRSIARRVLWARMTWPLASRYYAWHLRLLRLVAILALDDTHPAFLAHPPAGWPTSSLTREATLRRNRAWLRLFDRAFWRARGKHSDPWVTYLFNRTRADVFARHLDDAAAVWKREADQDVYSVTRTDLDRIARDTAIVERRALERVLFATHRAIGCDLARAHFHLRSLAIKPWRSHTSPCGRPSRKDRARFQTQRPSPVFPPHLMKFTTNFLFEKNPFARPPAVEDPAGRSERMLIDLPVLYWLIVEDGQWRSQWSTFSSSEFTPPGVS